MFTLFVFLLLLFKAALVPFLFVFGSRTTLSLLRMSDARCYPSLALSRIPLLDDERDSSFTSLAELTVSTETLLYASISSYLLEWDTLMTAAPALRSPKEGGIVIVDGKNASRCNAEISRAKNPYIAVYPKVSGYGEAAVG